MFSVHVLFEVHPCCVLVAFSTCCQVINLSLFLAFVACLWLHEVGTRMDVATEGGPSETGNGRGGPASRNCNKGGQDMDMSLLLLRLERLGHLKIAAGLQATTTRLVLSPFPPPHYFQPLLFFSFFLFSFCQRHCLAFDVLVCVCFAHVRIFYGSKKTTPSGRHAGVRVAMSTGASTSC